MSGDVNIVFSDVAGQHLFCTDGRFVALAEIRLDAHAMSGHAPTDDDCVREMLVNAYRVHHSSNSKEAQERVAEWAVSGLHLLPVPIRLVIAAIRGASPWHSQQ